MADSPTDPKADARLAETQRIAAAKTVQATLRDPPQAKTVQATLAGDLHVFQPTQPYKPGQPTVAVTLTDDGTGPEAELPPGAVLCDRYRIDTKLGAGGMGVVYRADDLMLGHPIAMKFLSLHLAGDSERLAALANELRAGWKISHPNVCRIYNMEKADIPDPSGGSAKLQLRFLVMEYIQGKNLNEILREGRLSRDQALSIAQDVCASLAAVHDQEMLHRDLKPSNIMIDDRGRGRLMDFGVAALAADAGREGLVGTPGYLSPESLEGHGASAQSDIYALGLILYEMFTGQPVFLASDVPTQIQEVRALDAPKLGAMAKIDPIVRRIILQCLKVNPADRPKSVRDVAAALSETAQKGLRTRTLAVGLVVTLMILLAHAAGWFAPMERFAYDVRARGQLFAPRPTDKLEHIDIDDGSLEAVGRWPWPYPRLGQIITELRRADPKVIALDVDFPDADLHSPRENLDGSWSVVDGDTAFADSISRAGNVLIGMAVPLDPSIADYSHPLIVPVLRDAARYSGAVSFVQMNDGVVRSLPLQVPYQNDIMPQFGLAVACAYFGVDPHSLVYRSSHLIIPRPGAGDIAIPARLAPYNLHGNLAPTLEIPWFGGGDWKTMYDYPAHQASSQHMPISQIWDVCQTSDRIRANDYRAQSNIENVYALFDPDQLDAFHAKIKVGTIPSYDDAAAWSKLMDQAIAAESPAIRDQLLDPAFKPENDQDKDHVTAVRMLPVCRENNGKLLQEQTDLRQKLHERLAGKAVMIGATATSMGDVARTPRNLACPGVVVHGAIFNAIVSGYFWTPAPLWVNMLIAAALGLLITAAVSWLSLPKACLAALVLVGSYVLFNVLVLFDLRHVTADLAGPVIMGVVVWAACSVMRLTALLKRAILAAGWTRKW